MKIERSRSRGLRATCSTICALVVGGEERLALAALGHRQHADEVGQPHVRRRLQLRVLVQEVVDLPRLVGDPDVERLLAATRSWKTMKFAQKISSRRRSIWNACSSCSPASRVDVRGLRRELGARGMDRLAARLEQRRHRAAAPASGPRGRGRCRRSSRAIATSRHAWPRPIGEETSSARCGRAAGAHPVRGARRGRLEAPGELVDQPVDEHRVARHRDVARRRRAGRARPPVSSASATPRSNGWQLSRSPWTTSTGQRTRRQIASTSSFVVATGSAVVHQQHVDPAVEPVGDGVLDLLRRVRLREHLAEEELEEARGSRARCSGGCPSPSPRALELLVEARRARPRRGAVGLSNGTPGRDARRSRARAPDAPQRSAPTARRRPRRCRRARRARSTVASITARQSDAHQLLEPRAGRVGLVGPAVAAAVVDDDAVSGARGSGPAPSRGASGRSGSAAGARSSCSRRRRPRSTGAARRGRRVPGLVGLRARGAASPGLRRRSTSRPRLEHEVERRLARRGGSA